MLVKSYEQDGDTLQNKFKQQESRWYLLGRLTYFWQQITLFSISEMPLLHCHLIVIVLATVSFCILLNFLFVVLFCFFEDKTIMRYFQRTGRINNTNGCLVQAGSLTRTSMTFKSDRCAGVISAEMVSNQSAKQMSSCGSHFLSQRSRRMAFFWWSDDVPVQGFCFFYEKCGRSTI